MPRLRLAICAACQHYRSEGIVNRCYIPSNLYTKGRIQIFKLPPSKKNYNGRCKDYVKKTD